MATERTTSTRYGEVSTAKLEQLRETFDTRRILDAVDKLDVIRYRIDGLRDDLLQLHSMAHDLINDAGPAGPLPECGIWETASDLSMEIFEWPEHLEALCGILDEFAELAPDDDLEDD